MNLTRNDDIYAAVDRVLRVRTVDLRESSDVNRMTGKFLKSLAKTGSQVVGFLWSTFCHDEFIMERCLKID